MRPKRGRPDAIPESARLARVHPPRGRTTRFRTKRALAAWLVANAADVAVLEVRRTLRGLAVRYVGTARPAPKGLAARLAGRVRPVTRSRRGLGPARVARRGRESGRG
jgi:hypothetical protein